MSAYIVSNTTASALISVLIDTGIIELNEANQFLNELFELNLESVNHRYNDDAQYEFPPFAKYTWDYANPKQWLQIGFLIDHYNYQACETDTFETSRIALLLDKTKNHFIGMFKCWLVGNGYSAKDLEKEPACNLPYSDEMEWGLNDN